MKRILLNLFLSIFSFALLAQNTKIDTRSMHRIMRDSIKMQHLLKKGKLNSQHQTKIITSKDVKALSANESDSLALIALYNSTNGDSWSKPWDLSQPVSTWYGITLDSNGRVVEIELDDNNLVGTIPPEIGNLTKLTILILYSNELTGTVPSELWNLTNLEDLELDDNELTGTIPPDIGNLVNLSELWLAENMFKGAIPPEIGSLTNIEYLYLYGNQFAGSIPSEIGNLTNLIELEIDDNLLTGSIPPEIGNLTNLTHLDFSYNQLNGEIPSKLGDLVNLDYINLSNNLISGSIPAEIGNLTSLSRLDLSNNRLNGEVPAEIGSMPNIQYIVLSYNNFSGTLPSEIENLNTLKGLYLNNNQFDNLPDLSALVGLNYFNVINNKLTFEDIVPNISKLSTYYYPQAKVGVVESITPNNGDYLELTVTVGGLGNTYQWYKDGTPIPSATSSSHIISSYDPALHAGVYYCKIKNPNAPLLTLLSHNTYVGTSANQYQVTVSSEPEEGGTIEGGGTYDDGATATLTATPNTGYLFVRWEHSDNYTVSVEPEFTITVSQNVEYVAIFKKGFVITTTANPTEGGNVTGANTYDYGETATLTATPNEGYRFVNWTQNGNEVSTNPEITFTVTQDSNFVAIFVKTFTINASANPTEGGTIEGAGTYDDGATATLTATPNEGYRFVNWTQNGNEVSTNSELTFTVTKDSNFVANFVKTFTISASANPAEGGTIAGAGTYDDGATATLTATPNEGYRFVNWTQNGNEVSTNPELTLTVTKDSNFVANFVKTFTISASASPAEGGTIAGAGTYDDGATATLTATPNEGYRFVNWTQNGTEVSSNSELVVTVTMDSVFVANFEHTTGITWNSSTKVKIFPNPATEIINIDADKVYKISLFDITGKLINEKQSESRRNQLDVSSLKPGIYFIKLTNSKTSLVYKFIKK